MSASQQSASQRPAIAWRGRGMKKLPMLNLSPHAHQNARAGEAVSRGCVHAYVLTRGRGGGGGVVAAARNTLMNVATSVFSLASLHLKSAFPASPPWPLLRRAGIRGAC
ncbi:hypothetical protein E2C01_045058 [Portunus trituberculatus]|uniref:Uncharacterized protein n=1 Tax=Portunus trituberculatus TaxID=210409 RepID=A0A5B7G0Z7_PORTR|nr:hypothetical protein [Portunus trituberculatus]